MLDIYPEDGGSRFIRHFGKYLYHISRRHIPNESILFVIKTQGVKSESSWRKQSEAKVT